MSEEIKEGIQPENTVVEETREATLSEGKKSFKWAWIVVICTAVAGAGCFVYTKYQQKQMMEMLAQANIYQGLFIGDTNVSGLSREDAIALIESEYQNIVRSQAITLVYDDEEWEVAFDDIEATVDAEAAVEEAYQYGRIGTDKERYNMVSDLLDTPKSIPVQFLYNDEKLDGFLEEVAEAFAQEMENSTMIRENGEFVISEEKEGREMNIAITRGDVLDIIKSMKSGEVAIAATVVEPQITYEDNQNITDLLGAYKTSYSGGDVNRNTNLVVGCEYINATVIAPGETFSAAEGLGRQTYERGYRSAGVYVNGRVESGMGGGVCQITTTLYNAAIYAELEIVERHPHSMTVGYVPLGRDAAIADYYKDLQIRNDTEYPIYIESYASGGVLAVNIYGKNTDTTNRTVEFDTVYEGTVPRPAEIVKEDPTLPAGERIVTHTGRTGSKVSVYKTVYENGVQISREWFSSSSYRAVADEVTIGTGEVLDGSNSNISGYDDGADKPNEPSALEELPAILSQNVDLDDEIE